MPDSQPIRTPVLTTSPLGFTAKNSVFGRKHQLMQTGFQLALFQVGTLLVQPFLKGILAS